MDLQKDVLKYKDEVVKHIQGAVQVPSVLGEAKEGMPFGEGPAKALAYFIELGKELGFNVVNYDNYACEIEFGEGEEVLGILGHVDVVPEGEGWDHPPYSGALVDGKIFGRGTLDDKGPSVIALYAMKAIMDSGVKLNRKVRMILGANEETGSKCLEYYFNTINRPQPTLAFTPDSTFPVTFAEKGIVRIKLVNKFENLKGVTIKGGNAFNSVAEKTRLSIPVSMLGDIEAKLAEYNNSHEYKIECEVKGDSYEMLSLGKSAHGSKPVLGYNSISAAFNFLKDVEVKNEDLAKLVAFFDKYIKMETNGELLGINFADEESGDLSLNIGVIKVEDGNVELCLDIRCPVTFANEKVIEGLRTTLEGVMEVVVDSNTKALYVPKDSFLVSTLMGVYQEITGDLESKPIAIGGGTYARKVDNGVAFGALLKSQEDNMHQKNEYLEVDKIDTLLKIYVEAIYKLSK